MSLAPDWDLRRLDDVADVRLGRQRSPKNHAGSQMRPYLRAANVAWSGLRLDDVKEMNFTDDEMAIYRLLPGDIVLSEASGSPDEVGKPAIWLGQIAECAFQNTLLRVRSRSPEPRYLLHFFSYLAQNGAFARKSRGVGIHHIGRASLAEWPIPTPPIPEQRRIVEILDGHLSRLDAASGSIRTAAIRLDRWELTALWEATHGQSGPSARLDEIAEVKLGRQRSPGNHSGDRMRPYLRAANVHWNRLRLDDVKEMNFTSTEEESYRLVPGDILVVEASGSAAEVGKSAVYEGSPADVCFQNTLLRIRSRSANPAYVQKYLLAEALAGRLIEESRGVGIHHIGRARLAGLRVEVPSIDEQSRRVSRAQAVLEASMRLRSGICAAQERSMGVRRSLLAAAFAGRLTGRAADDEVVEELANV